MIRESTKENDPLAQLTEVSTYPSMDTVLKFRLFLVIAPAGYGKTALVSDWVNKSSANTSWCSLTSADQDSHRFFAHFILALREAVPGFGPESEAMLDSLLRAHSTVEQLVTTVVKELYDHSHGELVLVLEDFHTVDEQGEISQFVSSFAQQAHPQWHLILTSRTLIGLTDLDLMVARGHVSGLGSEELAFQPQEIQILAEKRFRQRLTFEQAVRLTEITEGWITGVLLSANLRQWHDEEQVRTLRTSGIDVYSYFARQILDKQNPELRDFLLRTSFMEEFDAEFCSTVLGNGQWKIRSDLQDLLDQVQKNNLFVSGAGHNGTKIRYHSLFREFLRDQFIHDNPQEVRVVTRRLTDVYVASQQWERVHELLTRLDDVSAQIAFIEQHGQRMLRAGHMQLLIRWITALPNGILLNRVDVIVESLSIGDGPFVPSAGDSAESNGVLARSGSTVQRAEALRRPLDCAAIPGDRSIRRGHDNGQSNT